MRARKVHHDPATLEARQRFTIERVGRSSVFEQRLRSRENAERPVGAGTARALIQLPECIGCGIAVATAHARLDQLDERPTKKPRSSCPQACLAPASAAS